MLVALEALRDEWGVDFSIEVVDVDSEPQWVERYDELVPVLVVLEAGNVNVNVNEGERELCHYFLDRTALRAWLDACGGQGA
jgi:hypothetical protein